MKRFSSFVIAGLLSLAMTLPAFGAVETNADEWAAQSIEIAYEAGFLPEESLQKAKSQITRQEFGKMDVAESLYGREEVENLNASLNNTIFRLRRYLEDSPLPPGRYLVLGGVEFRWSGR